MLDQNTISDANHASMLGRVEASIMGESALIDETGRVYWEGGSSSTLYESFLPKLHQFGADHAQAALFTGLITLAFIGVLTGWLRRVLETSNNNNSGGLLFSSVLLTNIINWTIMRLPRIENKFLVTASIVLYFLESYNCSTRYYLANAISSPTELEEYIETLRQEKPIVTWKVNSFHYELRKIFTLSNLFRSSSSFLVSSITRKSQDNNGNNMLISPPPPPPRPKNCAPMFPFTRKVISHQATETYKYETCQDSTMAGVWRRAASISSTTESAPFTKIALTVLLVLSDKKSREDYFAQQSQFVNEHGRGDEFTEFSTDIQVAKFKPSMLAVRPVLEGEGGVVFSSTKLFRLTSFWLFTILGLTLPYRIYFKRHCDFLRVTVVKETSSSSSFSAFSKKRGTVYKRWLPSRAIMNPHTSQFRTFMQGQSLYNNAQQQIIDPSSSGG